MNRAIASARFLAPLFLVSLAAVGYETALTRYFAVAKWSEYGYWVISIVMAGFALSGVVLALSRDWFVRRSETILAALPTLLVITAAAGYYVTAVNPFNPLQLQNLATWQPQLWNIALYYAALLPFFFLAGVFISLTFVMHSDRIGAVYGFDLTGAGAGSALVLLLMYAVHPFDLVPVLLVPLAVAAFFRPPSQGRRFGWSAIAAVIALLVCGGTLVWSNPAAFNDFKAIYAPLHTPDAAVVAEIRAPRGDYLLLDDFTERVDIDVSNNAGMMGLPGPPRTFGLYRDGNRIAALPRPGPIDAGYAPATLDALPYLLIPGARVLLAGGSGGFRISERLALGAGHIQVMETEPVLADALRAGLGPSPPMASGTAVVVATGSVIAAARRAADGARFDIIDLAPDFLDTSDANATTFSVEAMSAFLGALTPGGLVSIPVSIRDFPVYALRVLAAAREALRQAGAVDPRAHVIVYRSAWNVRILLSPIPWSEERIAAVRAFCDERSFDVSWYPGMDVAAARASLYNDLPAVSFDAGEVDTSGPEDSIANEAEAILSGVSSPSGLTFDLSPMTLDRPFYYAILRLRHLGTILSRLEILPQAEVGALVNLAVLAQAVVIAALVLLVPLLAPGRVSGAGTGTWRPILYFPALGLGFLFIEIVVIEKASLWLNDRASGFAVVLTGMLVFSGLGSMAAGRSRAPRRLSAILCGAIIAWVLLMTVVLEPMILATLGWPWLVRVFLLLMLLAPVSVALGLPFPLGLTRVGHDSASSGFLPWAWGLNGAFSVVATPLANLIARQTGFERVLFCAAILYGIALLAFPAKRNRSAWHETPAPSLAAD